MYSFNKYSNRNQLTATKESPDPKKLIFPMSFLWGASASHFQTEGYGQEAELGLSDWSNWSHKPGNIADGSVADKASEFYDRFDTDINILSSLNLNAFRTSVNWAALLPDSPEKGSKRIANAQLLEYYKRVLSSLQDSGIKTFLTLFHFALPSWLAGEGGWLSPRAVDEFKFFTEILAKEIGPYVDYWNTINEPMVYVYQGYVSGYWPPGEKCNYYNAFAAVRNLLSAHAESYQVIKSYFPQSPISFANHWRPFIPLRVWNPFDHMVCYFRDRVFNHLFPYSISTGRFELPVPLSHMQDFRSLNGEIKNLKDSMDYLAVNYYTREFSLFQLSWPPDFFGRQAEESFLKVSDMGWEVYPEGMYKVLVKDIAPYRFDSNMNERPVVITENGYAQNFSPDMIDGEWSLEDHERVDYLVSHLISVHKAIKAGVKVIGYLHWSLTDNFEWAEGLTPRFGLVRVTYPDQTRSLRKSATEYAKIVRDNAIPVSFQMKES